MGNNRDNWQANAFCITFAASANIVRHPFGMYLQSVHHRREKMNLPPS